MLKIEKKIFKVLVTIYCLLCNLAIATTLEKKSSSQETSRLILVTSLPETLDANGEIIRKNKIFPLQTLTEADIKKIAQGDIAPKLLEGICASYTENPLDETNELLYLLNCRKQQDDRVLVDKTANGFKISDTYKVSPLKLFFVGSVSNNIDLNCENLINQKDFVQNIIDDYTHTLMGTMPTEIIAQYSDKCLNLLKDKIETSINNLGKNSQIDMIFFWNSLISYKETINKYMVSEYNTEVISAYNLIYNYLYKTLSFETYHGLGQLKNLIKLNENIMNTNKKHELSNSENQSLKKLFNDYEGDASNAITLNALTNLLNLTDKISITDVSNGFALYKIESNMFISMQSKMELLSEKTRNLLFCWRNLLLYKNS